MSSFQLERIPTLRPDVGVILNITPDHLDRYDSFEAYRDAKMNITANQTSDDILVYNMDDTNLTHIKTDAQLVGFSTVPGRSKAAFRWNGEHIEYNGENLMVSADCALRGSHNLANILAGLNAITPFITPGNTEEFLEHIQKVLRTFSGIEHRLEYVDTVNGVQYYNDSKATNVDAVNFAISSFDEPVILILGGYDKNGDFPQLIPNITKHVKHTIAIGKARGMIQEALSIDVDVEMCADLAEAIQSATAIAKSGDVVLLSPACASFDQYENYEHRGRHFKELVNEVE